MVTDCVADPPPPVHVSEKLDVFVSAPVDWLPLVLGVPFQSPLAAQLVAFVADQVKVALVPLVIVVGEAVSVIVGGGGSTVIVID